jgi:hypothetical protein
MLLNRIKAIGTIGRRLTLGETIGEVPTRHKRRFRSAQIAVGQAFLITAAIYILLRGWRRDIRVPLNFSSDSLFYLMQSKSTVDNGWWWFNSRVGAPFGLDLLAFPSNSNLDQAIVWAISRFLRDPAATVTLAWTLMVVLSGLSATWCLRRLGVSTINSVVAGTLFALCPYALYRNIDHFSLVIYLVPFACTAALLLASGRPPVSPFWKGCGALLTGCVLLGFDYIYYAFFGCFCIGIAALLGFVAYRDARILAAGGTCILLIAGSTLLNLAPSLYSWNRHGTPIILRDKVPAESEVYGLKIRQLLGPLDGHPVSLFSKWAEKETAAQFPLDNENVTSRLGLVGTIGFLGLLLLAPAAGGMEHGRTLLGASRLTLAAVLLATIGGFGSIFSLLVSPEIRSYNRICPFIAFFALTAVALAMDSLFKTRQQRFAAAVIVLVLGVVDQGTAATNMNTAYPTVAAEIRRLELFVRQLESRLPDGAIVLQLPFRTYLNDEGIARMQPYDHLKLYLVSHRIRWSYPALSNDQVLWQQAMARLDPRSLSSQLAADGFAAVVVDRYGYADNGAAVIAAIGPGFGGNTLIAETERYVALEIRPLAGTSEAAARIPIAPLAAASLAIGKCSGQALANVDRIGTTTLPLKQNVLHVPGSGVFKVVGWAVDQQGASAAQDVDVVIDQKPFPSIYGSDRRDVADGLKRPEYYKSGFTAAIPAEPLGKGSHTLSLRVVASGGKCYYQTPGLAITVD